MNNLSNLFEELSRIYPPLLFEAEDKIGEEWAWFSSTETLLGESRLRQVWREGSGGGVSVGLLVEQSRVCGISGRGMSGALRIRSRELSCLSRDRSFLGFMNLAIALGATQWLLL